MYLAEVLAVVAGLMVTIAAIVLAAWLDLRPLARGDNDSRREKRTGG